MDNKTLEEEKMMMTANTTKVLRRGEDDGDCKQHERSCSKLMARLVMSSPKFKLGYIHNSTITTF